MAPRSRGFARPRRAQSQYQWANLVPVVDALPAASTKLLIGGFVAGGDFDLTFERLYGFVTLQSDQNGASESQRAAVGAIVVTADAFVAGAASIPGPDVDDEADWLMHRYIINTHTFGSAASFISPTGTSMVIDNKARRRLPANSLVAIMLESAATSSGLLFESAWRALSRVRGT